MNTDNTAENKAESQDNENKETPSHPEKSNINDEMRHKISSLKQKIETDLFQQQAAARANFFIQPQPQQQSLYQPKFQEILTMINQTDLKIKNRTKSLEPKIKNLKQFTKKGTYLRELNKRKKARFQSVSFAYPENGGHSKTGSAYCKPAFDFFLPKNKTFSTGNIFFGINDYYPTRYSSFSNVSTRVDNFKPIAPKASKIPTKDYYKNEITNLTYRLFGENYKKDYRKNSFLTRERNKGTKKFL